MSREPDDKEKSHVALPHRHPAEEIARLKEQALDGSWEAAAELESTYGFYFQPSEAIFWGMIAVENGKEGSARYNLAFTLAGSPDPLHQRRARFWLKQMIAEKSEHSDLAKNLLQRLDRGKLDGSPFPERYPKW